MKRMLLPVTLLVCLVAGLASAARAQAVFESVSGDAFAKAIPNDFYLEGTRIPVNKNNAALLKNAKGGRVVLATLDTTGYSSQIQQKYTGMLISETHLSVCGVAIGVGSYGFGLDRPKPPSTADAKFNIYNQAGAKVGSCAVKYDASVEQPKPLSVSAPKDGPTRVYLGKYGVELK